MWYGNYNASPIDLLRLMSCESNKHPLIEVMSLLAIWVSDVITFVWIESEIWMILDPVMLSICRVSLGFISKLFCVNFASYMLVCPIPIVSFGL